MKDQAFSGTPIPCYKYDPSLTGGIRASSNADRKVPPRLTVPPLWRSNNEVERQRRLWHRCPQKVSCRCPDHCRRRQIKPSWIFRRDDRELRKLTRARHKLIQERTDHVNRVHQILEAVGIHRASVVSDIFGKAGQFILRSLLDGVAIEEIVERIPVARIKK